MLPGKIAAVVLVLLLAPCGARAQVMPPSCQSFTRSSSAAPDLVRRWLARSTDDHVTVCTRTGSGIPADAAPLYSGESGVTRQGAVCSFSSHGLTRVGTGAATQLRRYERSDAVAMAVAGGQCPQQHSAAQRYTETYDVSPAAFVSIMELWAAAAASAQTLDREICCEGRNAPSTAARDTLAAAATGKRLRAAIEAGRMKSAPVIRIVRVSGLAMRRRYALVVVDPDAHPAGSAYYVIYLSRWLAGAWHISGVADAAS